MLESLRDAERLKKGFNDSCALPVIFGVASTILSDKERDFFSQYKPFGFIVFQRNCDNLDQLSTLVASMRSCVGWHCPVLIDQEGGRVRRLKEPNWPYHPSSREVGDQGEDAVREQAKFLAELLFNVGIDVNCMPNCDVPFDARTDNVVGDRAYSDDVEKVVRYSQLFVEESARLGMSSTLKHMPGHGRARVDSHKELPVVEAGVDELMQSDFMPFINAIKEIPNAPYWGMVAHILFKQIDDQYPSSLSPVILNDLIRHEFGFQDHLLVTDDINMGALSKFGAVEEVCKQSLLAGMDIVLHCNGVIEQMEKIARAIPLMRDDTNGRIERWLNIRSTSIMSPESAKT